MQTTHHKSHSPHLRFDLSPPACPSHFPSRNHDPKHVAAPGHGLLSPVHTNHVRTTLHPTLLTANVQGSEEDALGTDHGTDHDAVAVLDHALGGRGRKEGGRVGTSTEGARKNIFFLDNRARSNGNPAQKAREDTTFPPPPPNPPSPCHADALPPSLPPSPPRTWTKRAVSGIAVKAKMGMEGRYLAINCAVFPVSVNTTIILASISKAVFTDEDATDSGAGMWPMKAMTVFRIVLELGGKERKRADSKERGREGGTEGGGAGKR